METNLQTRGSTKRFFRYLLGVIIITLQTSLSQAQLFTQDFNGAFPPVGPPQVSNPVGTGIADAGQGQVRWYRGDTTVVVDNGSAGLNPGRGGSGFAIVFNTYDIQAGGRASFLINNIDLSNVNPYGVLKFWMKNISGTDVVRVYARNGSNPFVQIGKASYGVYNDFTEITISLQAFSGGGNTTVDIAFEGTSDYGNDNMAIDDISVSTPAQMTYSSNSGYQKTQIDPYDKEIFRGINNQEVVRLRIKTIDVSNPLQLTGVYGKTTGTTSLTDVTGIKLWFTGSDSLFDAKTAIQLSSTITSPSTSIAFTNFARDLSSFDEGFTHFWITYDISTSAVLANSIDALLDSIKIGTTTYTVSNGNPAPSRIISVPRKFIKNAGLSTSVNGRGPATQFLFNKSMGIFPSSEYPNLAKGDIINTIAYDIATLGANQVAVSGTIKVYMSNTQNASFLKSTTWATAINDMTLVYDGPLTINPNVGSYEIPLTIPFEYTGSNMYIGFDWALSTPISTGAIYYCNSATVGGGNGNRSATSGTSSPTAITGSSAFRPSVHFGVISPANDLNIIAINTLSKLPRQAGAPHKVEAIVRNSGYNPVSAYNVNMSINGTNLFSSNKQVTLGWGESTTVTFDDFFPNNNGINTITVSVANDDKNSNNSLSYDQVVNPTTYSYSDGSAPFGALGYNTGAGIIANKYRANGGWLIDTVKVFIANTAAIETKKMFGVVLNSAGTIIAKSDTFTATANDLGKYVSFAIKTPKVVFNEDFYVGLSQVANAAGFFPVAYQTEIPVRRGAYYTAPASGGTPTEANTFGRFMIEASVGIPNPPQVVNIGVDTVICPGDSVILNAGNAGMTYLWSTGATTQTIVAKTSDTYSVTVRNDQGYPVTDSRVITLGPAPVSASIDTDYPKGACVGTPITFTTKGLNIGSAPTYVWRKNSTIIANANGASYTSSALSDNDTIRVTVTSNSACISGNNFASASIIVDVFPILPVSVNIASNATTQVCKLDPITFTASPTNGGTNPIYQWTINSSPISGENGVTFTTNTLSNNDTVRCLITPSESCDGQKLSNPIIVSILSPATAQFTSSVNTRTVQFTNTFTQTANFSWDFGDGGTSTSNNPSHTYTADGTYAVKLIAANNCGNDTVTNSVSIKTKDFSAAGIIGLSDACTQSNLAVIRLSVQNLRSDEAQNVNVAYQLNGGTVQTGTLATLAANATATVNFTQRANLSVDGSYTIRAWVNDAEDLDRSNDTTTFTVVNQARPNASFSNQIGINGAVAFTNTTTSDLTATYAWNFGDNATSTDANPSHTYTQSGTYTVNMIATSTCGSDTATQDVTVVVSGIALQANEKYVRAYPNPNNGLFNLTLQLTSADNILINVYNANGQIVHTQKLGYINNDNVSLDLSTLSPGIYNVNIQGQNTQITKRINIVR